MTVLNIEEQRRKYKAAVDSAMSERHNCSNNAEDLLAIQMRFRAAQIPLSQLEPDGKMSGADVEKKIERALRSYHTKRALYIYEQMVRQELSLPTANEDREKLYGSLSYLNWSPARLGATRGETHKQVTDNINKAVWVAHAMNARSWFRILGNYSEDSIDPPQEKYVIESLKKGGLGYAALDPSGAATEADMKALFEKQRCRAHLICARKAYQELTTRAIEDTLIQYYEDRITDSLAVAGAGPQDLLPVGQPVGNPQDILPAAHAKQHMLCAQKALDEIKAEKQTEKTLIPWRGRRVREHVAQAGKTLKDIFKGATDEDHASDFLDYEVACAEARYLEQKEGVIAAVPPVLKRKKEILRL